MAHSETTTTGQKQTSKNVLDGDTHTHSLSFSSWLHHHRNLHGVSDALIQLVEVPGIDHFDTHDADVAVQTVESTNPVLFAGQRQTTMTCEEDGVFCSICFHYYYRHLYGSIILDTISIVGELSTCFDHSSQLPPEEQVLTFQVCALFNLWLLLPDDLCNIGPGPPLVCED